MAAENFNITTLKESDAPGNDGQGAGAASSSAGSGAATPGAGAGQESTKPINEQSGGAGAGKQETAAAGSAASQQAAPGAQQQQTPNANGTPSNAATSNGLSSNKALTEDEIKALATRELLAKAGVDSVDDLLERLKPKQELTEEQKKEALTKYEAAIDSFAINNGLMTRDDLVRLDNVLKSDNNALAYAEFGKQFKEVKSDATQLEIETAFKLYYNIDSTDEQLKALGQKNIESLGTNLRNQITAKRDAAKERYDTELGKKDKLPAFSKAIRQSIADNVPEEISLYKQGEESVVFKVPKELRADLEKFLVQPEVFDEFLAAGDSQQLKAKLKDRIEGFMWLNNREAMAKTIFEAGISHGTAKGSTTGATASFKMNGNGAAPVLAAENEFTEADLGGIKKAFRQN